MMATFEQNLHIAKLRESLLQGCKNLRIDDQFFLICQLLCDPLLQLSDRQGRRRLMHLNREVKGFEQRKAAHVADEDRPSRLQGAQGASKYLEQVVETRKILNHRIE